MFLKHLKPVGKFYTFSGILGDIFLEPREIQEEKDYVNVKLKSNIYLLVQS